jgi:hypothetical protein
MNQETFILLAVIWNHGTRFALSTILPSVFCGASFPFWHIAPLAPVCPLHILIHTPGLENHLSLVTWCLWLRRRSLAVSLLANPTIHFLQGHYSDILSNIVYEIPHITIFSFTQFHRFCFQSNSFWIGLHFLWQTTVPFKSGTHSLASHALKYTCS